MIDIESFEDIPASYRRYLVQNEKKPIARALEQGWLEGC